MKTIFEKPKWNEGLSYLDRIEGGGNIKYKNNPAFGTNLAGLTKKAVVWWMAKRIGDEFENT